MVLVTVVVMTVTIVAERWQVAEVVMVRPNTLSEVVKVLDVMVDCAYNFFQSTSTSL